MPGVTCSSCGAAAPVGSRFCPACGAALGAAPAGERRLATILFADLVGSTALTAGLDPEDARALLERYFDVARAVLEEHGGTLEKFVGDAVLAAFGVPRSHGDDPDRAVRAGLELASRVESLGPQYAVRVGIATGEMLVAHAGGDLDLTGEAVNVAARIEQAAQRSQVLVDERTARACQVAELRPAGAIVAKGFGAPIEVHEALAAERDARALLDTPLIGRVDDLALVDLLVRRAFAARVPALVTVVGEAGLGKTRLVSEALAGLRGARPAPRMLSGRSPSYGRGVAFWALGEVLREVAQTGPEASPDVVLAALQARLTELGVAEAAELAADLAVAVGRSDAAAAPVVERLRRAWRRLLALLSAELPLVLVLDDVHWADDGTLDLIEDSLVGAGDLPLAILCTARPELLERRPAWSGGLRGSGVVHLAPLNGTDAEELAAALLRGSGAPTDTTLVERIAGLGAGNPFFTEELACCNAELLIDDGGTLPDSVQGAVIARLDQLPAAERSTLQAAAVLGVRFSADGVRALTGADPDGWLEGLARSAVIVAEPQAGPGSHAFRHQILRDVAYGTLPRPARSELHERAASWTAQTAGERLPELSEIVAYHRERAAELSGDDERRGLAARELIAAAWHAALRGAVDQADALFERAAAIAPAADLAVRAHREAAEVAIWGSMRGDRALDHQCRASEIAHAAGDRHLEVVALATMVEIHIRYPGIVGAGAAGAEAAKVLSRVLELADGGDAEERARVALAEAWVATDVAFNQVRAAPEPIDAVAAGERACQLAEQADDPVLQSSALDALDGAYRAAGRPAAATAAALRRRALGPRLVAPGAPSAEWFDALNMIADALERVGDFSEALEAAREARAAQLRRGLEHSAHTRLCAPLFELGGWDEVVAEMTRFQAGWEAAGRPPSGFAREPVAIALTIPGLRGDAELAAAWSAVWELLEAHAGTSTIGWPGRAALVVSRARVALQRGHPDAAAGELRWDPRVVSTYLRERYAAHRAEAAVRAGAPDASAHLAAASALIAEDRFAVGLLARARALHDDDAGSLLSAHAALGEIGAFYEQARTGLDLGGEHAADGRAFLSDLGVPA